MYEIYHHLNNFSVCRLDNGTEIIFDHNFKEQFLNFLLETKQITRI